LAGLQENHGAALTGICISAPTEISASPAVSRCFAAMTARRRSRASLRSVQGASADWNESSRDDNSQMACSIAITIMILADGWANIADGGYQTNRLHQFGLQRLQLHFGHLPLNQCETANIRFHLAVTAVMHNPFD
jgi:hypothetical protein